MAVTAIVRRLIVIALATLGCGVGVTFASRAPLVRFHVSPHLSAIASALSGRQVSVRCVADPDWLPFLRYELGHPVAAVGAPTGFTFFSIEQIYLASSICTELAELHAMEAGKISPFDPTYPIMVLTHESEHAAGFRNEAVAECYAMQRLSRAFQLFGFSRNLGRQAAGDYWAIRYPSDPPHYQSSQCHNGGRLDLNLNGNSWP